MTMLERVAEAVSQKVMEAPFAILEGHQREYVLSVARAAIEALMEPTEEMINAPAFDEDVGATETPFRKLLKEIRPQIFRSMLKAALEEGK